MDLLQNLSYLRKTLEDFLSAVVLIEEKNWEVALRIERLEDIVFGKKKDYWQLSQRFASLKKWLTDDGIKLLEGKINQKQLERIILCIEKIKDHKDRIKDKKNIDLIDKVLRLSNSFVKESTRKIGLEYSPLGLIESDQTQIREKFLEKSHPEENLKQEFEKVLHYQREMLKFFYKPQDHLLSILDYQLGTLEVRPTVEDELFSASLIYFLKQKNYKVNPYVERFRKITAKVAKPKER
jgi:hypothetical protein